MTVITVGQLNRYVKSVLEGDSHLVCVTVVGEISNFTDHRASGHWYFTLKDEDAVVKAVMFRSQNRRVRFVPENGMRVIVTARASLYERDGSFQLYADDMQPDGIGALQLAYEQLKNRLAAEGVFDESRKKPLPRFPRTVGIITSPTGAALHDMLTVLGRRYPLAQVLLAPVLVQGDGAPSELCAALRRFARMYEADDPKTPDVILIGRGGGSLEELWAFNSELLARQLAIMPIPVISGVGHETDFTICDFAADLRAPTPSAAAELAVPDKQELSEQLRLWSYRTVQVMRSALTARQGQWEQLRAHRCLQSPRFALEERAVLLDRQVQRLSASGTRCLAERRAVFTALVAKLEALSPLNVLARGYTVARSNGTVLRTAKTVAVGDTVTVELVDGELDCTVTTKRMKQEDPV